MSFQLHGQNALVGGSTDGIGKEVAMVLAEMGANVTLLARNEMKLKNMLSLMPKTERQMHDYIIADFFEAEKVGLTVKSYLERHGKHFDILINNTGGPPTGPLIEKTGGDLMKHMGQHLYCFHELVQAVAPAMKTQGYGRIVNITSNAAKQPLPNMGISNTVRGAISNWSKTLANELGHEITVNCVLPGPTDTKELRDIIDDKAKKSGKPIKEIYQALQGKVPLGRLGQPREIAHVVAFMASPMASFVNGVNWVVDGGKTESV